MKILMLAPQPLFEHRGTPLSVLGRLKALTILGHEVDVVTYHIGQFLTTPGVTVHRIPNVPFITSIDVGPSFKKLLLDGVLLIKAIHLLMKGRYDLLHSHEEASFFGVVLAKVFGLPHLYDMHSSLPQQLVNFQYTRFRPLIRLFEWLERRAILGSNLVITICPELENHLKRISGRTPSVMIENIFTWQDPDAISETMIQAFRSSHSLDGKKIVFYGGSFEPYQGIGLLIESAETVTRRFKDVLFLLMGGTCEQNSHYEKQVSKLGLSDYFRFFGKQSYDQVAVGMKVADLVISPRTNGNNTPLKVYDYLRSGKPIVATNLATHTQVLDPSAVVLVEPNPEAVARGILSVLEDPALGEGLGVRARQLFESQYQFQVFVQKTADALQLAVN